MPDEFVSLREYLRVPDSVPPVEEKAPTVLGDPARDEVVLFEIGSEMRRFRAALRDGFEAARECLLRDIACEVLGRELQLAPADIDAIVSRACAQADAPASIRVHPMDAEALAAWTCDVETDATLHRGDAVLCVSEGTIDASLGVRLEGVLERRTCG